MARHARDGRVFEASLVCGVETLDDGRTQIRSPGVGLWRGAPAPGTMITPGADLGELETLGRLVRLEAPPGATGVVVELPEGPHVARRPVGYGDRLAVVDPKAAEGVIHDAVEEDAAAAFEGLVFKSPSSGRFYSRPAPDEDPFVNEGDVISRGQTVALLEVMKTFNRIAYGGDDLPERAKVKRVVPDNESDLDAGDVILELEEA